jgi:anti-anti-sigma factor
MPLPQIGDGRYATKLRTALLKVTKMELKVSHEQGYVLAATSGAIDDAARDLFREGLHPLVGQSGTQVVLDLSQSNFITSIGIGQLVSLVTHANTSGSRVVLAACSPFISVVFSRCKLNKFFDMADSIPDAIGLALANR